MPRYAANISLMYAEWPLLERAREAAADGFEAVEVQFPYAHDIGAWREALDAADRPLVLLNAPPGEAGERGLGCLPERRDAFRAGVETALRYAQALGCPRVHVMAGIAPVDADRARLRSTFVENLSWAAPRAHDAGVTLLVEPLNPFDMPGYFLSRQADAHAIVREVGAPNLKVQLDLYHVGRVEGDVEAELRRELASGRVGHLQVASVPDRHEPDRPDWLALIDALGWDGYVGAEYRPRAATRDGLGWLRA